MNQSANSLESSAAIPGPKTRIRLYLRASNLPKSLISQGYRQPDSLARVSVIIPVDNGSTRSAPIGEVHQDQTLIDETEVVHKSSNPRWTVSFSVQYEYGSQLLFFVEVFAIRDGEAESMEKGAQSSSNESFLRASFGGKVSKREIKLLGQAVFDIQDLLGTKSRVKARRLKRGGVVYAHIEQQPGTICSSVATANEASALDFRSSRNSTEIDEISSTPMLTLQLRGSSLVHTHSFHSKVSPKTVSKPDTYFEIARPSNSGWIVVYRSSLVTESLSPLWDEAELPLYLLCSGSHHASIGENLDLNEHRLIVTVYKSKRKKCKAIGLFETTIQALIYASLSVNGHYAEDNISTLEKTTDEMQFDSIKCDENRGTFQLRPNTPGSDNEITGFISILNARIDEKHRRNSQRFLTSDSYDESSTITSMEDFPESTTIRSMPSSSQATMHKFLDYVNAGLDVDFCISIDFTSSNGDPRVPGTHHYSRDGMMNDYEEAIESIGTTIGKYSTSKQYPVWGFGAKYDGEVRHIFQCGANPFATDVKGVLRAYRSVFETDLIMSGPTVLSSVLKAAASRARAFKATELKYCVLLILTDGIVTDSDFGRTQQLIQSYKDLPLSIVMVGIGRADFTLMQNWNSSPSEVGGNFSFVSYRQHQYDSVALSKAALQRVPFDIRDYFARRGILPE